MKTQLETQLSDDLQQIVASQPFAPDVAAIERRGRQLRRRSAAARGAAGLGVAAGITAVALAVSTAQPGTAQPGGAQAGGAQAGGAPPHPAAAGPAPSGTVIAARTVAAISSVASNSVLQTVVTTAAGVNRFTVDAPDQVTEEVHRSSAGRIVSRMAMRQDPGRAGEYQNRVVDYAARAWTEMDLGGRIPNPATEYLTVFKPSPNGRVRFAGSAVLDGQPVWIIHFTGLHDTRVTATDWISKATSLPIKSVSPGATVAYHWSGPGTVSAASLWPSVPAGFAKVPPMLGITRFKEGR